MNACFLSISEERVGHGVDVKSSGHITTTPKAYTLVHVLLKQAILHSHAAFKSREAFVRNRLLIGEISSTKFKIKSPII